MTKTFFDLVHRGFFVMMLFAMLSIVACEEDDSLLDDTDMDDVVGGEDDEDYVSSLKLSSVYVYCGDDYYWAEVDNDARTIEMWGVKKSSDITDITYKTNITAFPSVPIADFIEGWQSGSGTTLSFWDTKATVDYTVNLPDYDRGEDNIIKISLAEDNVKQKVVFIGVDMERSQGFLQTATNKEDVAKWVFQDIDFNVCRCSYDKKQELVQGTKNLETFYANCLATMHLIREVNPNVEFWATMKSDYNGYDNENNLPDWIYDYEGKTYFETKLYAGFLADYLEHMHTNGITIKYLSTAKEWSGVVTVARAKEIIDYLIEELEERDVPIPLFNDCEAWSTQGAYSWVNTTINNGYEDYYWGFSTHNYNSTGHNYNYGDMINRAAESTKSKKAELMEYWGEDPDAPYYCIQSETGGAVLGATSGVDSAAGLPLGQFIDKCNFFAYGMNGELMFEVWSRSVASETRSIYFTSSNPVATRLSNYYALHSHGNFFQDGMHYLGSEQTNITLDTYGVMQFANEDQLYVAFINNTEDAIDNLYITLDDESYFGSVRHHVMDKVTVKEEGLLSGKYYDRELWKGAMEVEVPAYSLNFFKIDLTERQ